jgi:hypothetical protein
MFIIQLVTGSGKAQVCLYPVVCKPGANKVEVKGMANQGDGLSHGANGQDLNDQCHRVGDP